MLEIENLSYSYIGNNKILDDISFNIEEGKFISLLGANGAGKSTLFKCILGIIQNYKGKVSIDNIDIKTLNSRELSKYFTYIPQVANTTYNYKVIDVVLMGLARYLGLFSLPKKEQEDIAFEALKKFGIESLANKNFDRISGGEKQLVMLARALAQNSKVWVLDEPCSNLDYGNQIRILNILKELAKEGYIIIISIHNPEQAYYFSDEIIILNGKKILDKGNPKFIINKELIKKVYDVEVELYNLDEINKAIIPKTFVRDI